MGLLKHTKRVVAAGNSSPSGNVVLMCAVHEAYGMPNRSLDMKMLFAPINEVNTTNTAMVGYVH